jgi:HPt (histidine-containing phosphotransfer) domain-containing protein/PAS domain-containing protein
VARPARRVGASGVVVGILVVLLVCALAWLWKKTQSLNPEDHSHLDAALRELRSLDRTINQDVLRARYKLIDSYEPVLSSYRRVEELELVIASPPRFLDAHAQTRLADAVHSYRASVTQKQQLIEQVKYRSADLRELLGYLPGAGTALARAASNNGDRFLAEQVNNVLQIVLLYNLTSDEEYAPVIGMRLGLLSAGAEHSDSPAIRRRLRTLITNIHRLLKVKPAVDGLLASIFRQPIIEHEDEVARVYYAGYAAAEREAKRYRVVLYALCVALLGLLAYGVRRLQHTARALAASNELLEERVVERTRELRAVLDNVEEALFTVDLEGRLARERSAVLSSWFPAAQSDSPLWDVVRPTDPNAASWLELGWEQLREGILPVGVALGQLPTALTGAATGRHYRVDYRPIGDPSRPDKILVVISDVTEQRERERREQEQQEHLMMFQHARIDGVNFEEAIAEMDRLVQMILDCGCPDRHTLLRTLHTIKGNAGMYGFTSLAALCHELETKIADTGRGLPDPDLDRLADVWATITDKVQVLIGNTQRASIEIARADLARLGQAVATGLPPAELLRLLRHIERDPIDPRLARLADQARRLATGLGKGVDVRTEGNGVRLDSRRWAAFWPSLVHLLRNALDHGIEAPDERERAGKARAGSLALLAREVGDRIVIEVSDDGRGIEWERVRAVAASRGLPAATDQDLIAALFGGGLSTKSEATIYSGRGAGLSACYWACQEMGGTLTVSSAQGRGATFRFSIPSDESLSPRLTSAA